MMIMMHIIIIIIINDMIVMMMMVMMMLMISSIINTTIVIIIITMSMIMMMMVIITIINTICLSLRRLLLYRPEQWPELTLKDVFSKARASPSATLKDVGKMWCYVILCQYSVAV